MILIIPNLQKYGLIRRIHRQEANGIFVIAPLM
jgi:hypothetical protein